jgi:small subunit ribosomal protein S1
LSIKAREVDEEKKAMAEFGSAESGASLGDILGAAIRRRQGAADEKGEAEEKSETEETSEENEEEEKG